MSQTPEITKDNVVHIYDDGFPLCYTRSRDGREERGTLWKVGPMVRQHALANCPDCLDTAGRNRSRDA